MTDKQHHNNIFKRIMEEQLSLFDFDASDLKNGWICGCDEAGRGPLAGPVTVAAVILPPDFDTSILNDSKKMSEKKREEAALVIKEKAVAYSVVFIDEKTIDKINILRATMQGMKQCYEEIRKDHEFAAYYVDGNRKPDISDGTYVEAVVKGDGKIPQIIQSVISAFGNTDWGSIGRNIISGIANGLASAGGALWDAVKGVLGSFKDNVLAFFGIASPARWGIYVGNMIDAGIAGGLERGRNAIADAVRKVQETVKTPIYADARYAFRRSEYTADADSSLLTRIEELIYLLRENAGRPVEISLTVKDREIIRVLREMGVVFD